MESCIGWIGGKRLLRKAILERVPLCQTVKELFPGCQHPVQFLLYFAAVILYAAALFYLDPPYVGTEGYYSCPFKAEDHQRLKGVLEGIKGRFTCRRFFTFSRYSAAWSIVADRVA